MSAAGRAAAPPFAAGRALLALLLLILPPLVPAPAGRTAAQELPAAGPLAAPPAGSPAAPTAVPPAASTASPAAPPPPASPSPPAGAACPARLSRLRVAIVDPPPRLEVGLTAAALLAESGGAAPANTHHLGLTTSRVEWRSELNARFSREPEARGPAGPDAPRGRPAPESVCAVPAELVLTLIQAEHVMRIAAEIPPDGCLFGQVAAHERRHAAINRRTLRAAAADARAAATEWAATAEGRGATVEEAMGHLQAGLRRAIEPALARMREARGLAHQAIDRPAEYRRLGQVCPQDQQVLRARVRDLAAD